MGDPEASSHISHLSADPPSNKPEGFPGDRISGCKLLQLAEVIEPICHVLDGA